MTETPIDTKAVAERYRRLSADIAARIAAVPADRWASPSPCEGWDARGVVRHLVDVQGMFLGFVGGALPPGPDVAADPGEAWRSASGAVQKELDDPARAAAEFDGIFGRTTLAASVDRFACFDMLVHGWDLARATGGDERIDPAELGWLRATAEGFGEGIRSPQVCGPELTPPDGADEQTKLLAFLGRRAW
jgi:uncharacterized protein (TIGR03086 family)